MLQQAMFHIVVNAVKFSRAKGTVRISLDIKRRKAHYFLDCEVWNEGAGIAPERIGSLFSAFENDAAD